MKISEAIKKFSFLVKGLLYVALCFLITGFVCSFIGVWAYFGGNFVLSAATFYLGIMLIVFSLGVVSFVESYIGWRVWVGIFAGGSSFAIFAVMVLLSFFPFFVFVPHFVKVVSVSVGFMGMVLGLSGFARLWRLVVGEGEKGG